MASVVTTLSQFFIISSRGDTIISRNYRGDVQRGLGTAETFYRTVKFWASEGDCAIQHPSSSGADAPPTFNVNGINYLFVKKNGLYFVCTSKFNVSPAFVIELLSRLARCFKDYCGVLTEESIRKNFILIYELLDETMDYGYPQFTSTERLKTFVYNEPVVVRQARVPTARLAALNKKTTSAQAVHKPISLRNANKKSAKEHRNEIFVDILERLSVLFNANGYVLNSEIDGCIQMKSYLSGNPELRLALNEDLIVGKGAPVGFSTVILDDCNFHECCNLAEFEEARQLTFLPPDGEFVVMNYRMTGDFRVPFRLYPFLEETGPCKVEVILKARADMPEVNYGANVKIAFGVPKRTAAVALSVGSGSVAAGQTAEYTARDQTVVWSIKKFFGGNEFTLRAKITLNEASASSVRKEIGPVSMTFEIPMFNVSNLQVRYLRIAETHKAYSPFRWVRYVTQSNSYVCRL